MSALKPIIERKPKSNAFIHEDPLIDRIMKNRGVKSPDELNYTLSKLLPPSLLKGMGEGTDILIKHIMAGSKIVIVGDYDCDGATATTIAVEGLRLCGAKSVDFIVPDRGIHGYGLSRPIVELVGKSKPDLIVTVDNGIASFDGCKAVKELSHPCELLITDHHLAVESGEVPDAEGIINPNQPGCNFPSKNIAGCGVMFYVVMGLRAKMEEQGYFEKLNMEKPKLNSLLDVLALGTVADVVTLDYNNRVLIDAGLRYINRGHCRPGLKHILELKKRTIGKIVSSDMGFSAGPCLNAAGRLDDMSLGIQCLMEKNDFEAEKLAKNLVNLNEQRKEIEGEMVGDALEMLQDIDISDDGVCIFQPYWHEGVVGIVASRIKDRSNRPTICFTDTHDASKVRDIIKDAIQQSASEEAIGLLQLQQSGCDMKGSARSIKGVHLKHALDNIFKKQPEIMTTSAGVAKFGGHAMAAGISLKIENYDKFRVLFDKEIKKQMTPEMRLGAIEVDYKNVPAEYLTLENADLISSLGPWGQNFELPTFSKRLIVKDYKIRAEKHLSITLEDPETKKIFESIQFNCVDEDGVRTAIGNEIEVAFKLSVNEWMGRRNLQFMIEFSQDESFIAKKENDKIAVSQKDVIEPDDNASSQVKDCPSVAEKKEQKISNRLKQQLASFDSFGI